MSQDEPRTKIKAPLAVVPSSGPADAHPAPSADEMSLGQAARKIGVPSDVLRDLCDAGLVDSERRRAGHRYLKTLDVPDRQWIDEQVARRYRQAVLAAQASARRVAVELEAIALDLAEAADDLPGHMPLGEDLRRCHLLGGSFNNAVCDLRDAAAAAATAHLRAAALHRLRPTLPPGAAETA